MKVATRRSLQFGVSMVEILVALAVGLFLTAGIIQLFISNRQSYVAEEALSRLQESGRYALHLLARELRMAGNLGCRSLGQAEYRDVLNVVALDSEGDRLSVTTTERLGYDASEKGSVDGPWAAKWSGSTDALMLFGVFRKGTYLGNKMGSVRDDDLVLNSNGFGANRGDVLLVTDCEGVDIFKVSNDTDGSGTTIAHQAGDDSKYNASDILARAYNYPGDIAAGVAGTTIKAMVFPFDIKTYYVGSDGDESYLYMWNGTASQQVVEGVQAMILHWGEDTSDPPDQVPDVYRDAGPAVDWSRVRSVRVDLVLQSLDQAASEVLPFTFDGVEWNTGQDRRLRAVFSTTVALRARMP